MAHICKNTPGLVILRCQYSASSSAGHKDPPPPLHVTLSSLLLVMCRVAAMKRLPVQHHCADYIFWSFGNIGFILSPFAQTGTRRRGRCFTTALLHMNRRNKTESIFVSLMCSLLPEDLHSEFISHNRQVQTTIK